MLDLARDVMVEEDSPRVFAFESVSVQQPLAFCDSSVPICEIRGQKLRLQISPSQRRLRLRQRHKNDSGTGDEKEKAQRP